MTELMFYSLVGLGLLILIGWLGSIMLEKFLPFNYCVKCQKRIKKITKSWEK